MKKTNYIHPTSTVFQMDLQDVLTASGYSHSAEGEGDWVSWSDYSGEAFR